MYLFVYCYSMVFMVVLLLFSINVEEMKQVPFLMIPVIIYLMVTTRYAPLFCCPGILLFLFGGGS